MKKTVSVILSLIMVFSLFSVCLTPSYAASASEEKIASCNGDCEFFPTIIIPGLGQSSVCVTDDNGNFILDKDGNKVSAFPAYLQVGKIIRKAIFPALLSIATQRDVGLSDAFAAIIDDSFGINACDLNAKPIGNVKVEKFMYPYSKCSEYEKGLMNMHIPFEKYPSDLPADHIYYFAYNSFDNNIDLANELYNYIQMVKKQTGHSKVNLVPISQGGTIFSGMLEYHPEVADDLHKIMCIVPALDGSIIIGDVFNGRVNFLNKDYLYNGFLEELRLLDEKTARIIEIAVRILPDEVVMATLNKGVKHLVENVMTRSTSMWCLCPSADYPTAAERYLSSPEMAKIKEQTDKYYQAQLHARDNIQSLVDRGIPVFCVAQYDYAVINVGENWNKQNGDFIIQLDSTSMGACSANCGEQLPAGYAQKNTHCSNPDHNHISPDRVVDASAGLLPDTTFYFKGQRHDLTQHNDVILEWAMEMIAHDDIKDVYSSPRYPQFLSGRDVRNIEALIESAEKLDKSKLRGNDADKLDKAVKDAKAVLDDTLATSADFEAKETALSDILVKYGAAEKVKNEDPSFLRKISLWLYDKFGTNGYSEIPIEFVKGLFHIG